MAIDQAAHIALGMMAYRVSSMMNPDYTSEEHLRYGKELVAQSLAEARQLVRNQNLIKAAHSLMPNADPAHSCLTCGKFTGIGDCQACSPDDVDAWVSRKAEGSDD